MVHASYGWTQFQIIVPGSVCQVFLLKSFDQYRVGLVTCLKGAEKLKCGHVTILFFATQLYKYL